MTFDPAISLGQVLTIVGFIITMVTAHYALKGRLIRIEASNESQGKIMEAMQREIEKMNDMRQDFARLDERQLATQKELTELKHGKGLIN